MEKIKAIYVMTSNNHWWELLEIYPDNMPDEGIAKLVVSENYVVPVMDLHEGRVIEDNMLFLNVDNIIAVKIVRKSEDK